jgi:hypothetical protein
MAILILSTVNVLLAVFAAWQRHQTVKPVLEKRRKKAEKLARREAA